MVGATAIVGLYVGGIIVYGFTAIFEPIIQEFGWSYAAVSLAASLRGAETGLLEPVAGRFVDRWGSRRLILLGGLFTAAGLFLLSNTTSLAMFYGSFVLLAVGMSACGTTVLVTGIANWFRAKLGFATGVALCGFGLGGLMLPVMVSLIAHYGWRTSFAMLGAGAIVLLLPLSLVFRHRPEDYGYAPDGREPEPAVSAQPHASIDARLPDDGHIDVRRAVKTPAFWLLTVSFTVFTGANLTTVSHVMPYLSSIGFTRTSAGAVATIAPLLSIVGRLGLGALGDRLNRTRVSFAAYVMVGLGMLCFAAVPVSGLWTLLPFLLLFGIGYGGVTALRPALTREYFGRGHFGSIFGLVMGINAIGGIVGPPLAGRTFDVLGDYRPVWIVIAVLCLTAACLILVGSRHRPQLQSSRP